MPFQDTLRSNVVIGALDNNGNPVTGTKNMYARLPPDFEAGTRFNARIPRELPGAGCMLQYEVAPGACGGMAVVLPVEYRLVSVGNDLKHDSSDSFVHSSRASATGNDEPERTAPHPYNTRAKRNRV